MIYPKLIASHYVQFNMGLHFIQNTYEFNGSSDPIFKEYKKNGKQYFSWARLQCVSVH